MRKILLLVLCLLALVSGEGGVLLLHLPWGYALVVAIVSVVLGILSWHGGGTRTVFSADETFEHFIHEMTVACPWMARNDVALLRVAFCSINAFAPTGRDIDEVARAAWQLHDRARSAGDLRRAWAFEQRYQEVCAWKQGQEYAWPPLPHVLEER